MDDTLTLMNQTNEATNEYKKAPADDLFRLTGEAILAARAGDKAGAERVVTHIRQLFGAAASYQYAQIYAQAGEVGEAFAELGNAALARDPGLSYLKRDLFLDPIRSDQRYAALLKKLNFP